jgi:hypothetical protein
VRSSGTVAACAGVREHHPSRAAVRAQARMVLVTRILLAAAMIISRLGRGRLLLRRL